LTLPEARAYLAAGEFHAGSMGPKVEAGINFVASGGERCIITSAEHVVRALEGATGTHIVPS
jgi:carbamate kinase